MTAKTRSPAEIALWVLAAAGLILGVIGLVQRIAGGGTVTAYSTYVPWGLWVAAYVTLIGVSVGAFIVFALARAFGIAALRPVAPLALYAALGSLAGGLFAVWIDLGRPERFYKLFFSTSGTSVMGLVTWLYTLYGILLVVLIYLLARQPASALIRPLTIAGLVLVVAFGGGEGALFGVVGAQAFWESSLLPVAFLVEGAFSGIALVLFLGVLLGKLDAPGQQILRWAVLGLLIGVVILEWAELSTTLYAGIPARIESLNLILFGPFWWVFWFVQLGLGLVLPFLLLAFAGRNPAALAAAGGLVAFAAIAKKVNLVIPALVVPDLEGLKTAYTGTGLTFDYFPTTTEWFVTLLAAALAALVFLALFRFVSSKPSETPG
jgi:molybdopterin-containing oxidoreductase family membrane subunit